ncbi:hypothetical protein [Streptomyces triticisoli]|jgi:hypothetical protein|uniref:hypothetical protein n=1 Tax=Streptomyces triticisoli TaxID=2182797 RepID=UPI000DDB20BE|nr:hypothetical protein [Streptomyces triticisoli]
MNPAPQVATAEISDADLDNVSGGLAAGGSGDLCVETPVATVTSDLLAVATPEGVAAGTAVHTAAH